MTLLQFFFITSSFIILIIGFDIAKKQRFNALHFLVFLGIGGGLLVFTLFPTVLQLVGHIFGVARGADVLVYGSIVFLLYFVLLLLTKHVDNKENITQLVREFAIEKSEKKIIKGKELFLIRAYNEGKVISGVIQEIIDSGYKNILVIDDGSTDNTKQVLEKFGSKIVVLSHFKNRGAGAALETGFEYIRRYSEVQKVLTFDADGQHSVEDAIGMFESMDQSKETFVLFGSRFIGERKSNIPFFRKIILFLGRVFTFFVSKVFLTDAHNGLRLFDIEVIKKIHLTIDSMAYASELIDTIVKSGYKIKEVPVTIKYTKYSLEKGQSSGNAFSIALRILWGKFFR